LTHGRENIVEAYYTAYLTRGISVAAGFNTSRIRVTTKVADPFLLELSEYMRMSKIRRILSPEGAGAGQQPS